jgi:putative hemolysin
MPAIKAFDSFRRAEADFIFVMDQYGGFTGLVSLRDLMEEIVGELVSSTGDADSIVPLEDGTWLADGSVNIDDAVEQFSMPANEAGPPDYHTLAGFVLSLAGELPRPGDSFAYGGFRFKVSAMDGNRIDKIHVSRL